MKILLMGNHSCSNRGDAAISRGLISFLEQKIPQAEITCVSRYPLSASYFLGRDYYADGIFDYYHKPRKGIMGRIVNYLIHRSLSLVLAFMVKVPLLKKLNLLPKKIRDEIAFISGFDVVIQVGGSNLVDLYGSSQFDYGLCSILAQKRPFLLGHSVGPFQSKTSRFLAKTYFKYCSIIGLREKESLKVLLDCNINTKNVSIIPDTAWLLAGQHSFKFEKNSKKIALTLRTLTPFESRLGMTNKEYLTYMAKLCDNLIERGYRINLYSTCTGFDNYKNDDRLMAIRLKNSCKNKSQIFVEMAELSDIELGEKFASCALTIATRLHSGILSMAFNTPALLLNYEHKSAGVADLMDLKDLSVSLTFIKDDRFLNLVLSHLTDLDLLEKKVQQAVLAQCMNLENALDLVIKEFNKYHEG